MNYFIFKLLGSVLRFIFEIIRSVIKGEKLPSYKEISKRLDNAFLGVISLIILLIFLYFIGVLA